MAIVTRDFLLDTHGSRTAVGALWYENENYPVLRDAHGWAGTVLFFAGDLGTSLIFNAGLDGTGWTWDSVDPQPGDLTVTTGGTIGLSPVAPLTLTSASIWLYLFATEWPSVQDMHFWLDADPTPADYDAVSYPGTRSEVHFGTVPYTDQYEGWIEFPLSAAAVTEINSSVTTQAAWDGRISFVVMTEEIPSTIFAIWGIYSPYLRVRYDVPGLETPGGIHRMLVPRRPDTGIEGGKARDIVKRSFRS